MKKKITYALITLILFGMSSCLPLAKDELEPCPPLQLELIVEDKNYTNVDDLKDTDTGQPLETRKSETLSFGSYVPTLYYVLRNVATGETVEEKGVFNVTGDGATYNVTFPEDLPFGKYALTVWGGLKDNHSLMDDSHCVILHDGDAEVSDIYMAHDTLVYDDVNYLYSPIPLKRVTGKLFVQYVGFPLTAFNSQYTIDNLYKQVDCQMAYTTVLTVNRHDEWTGTATILRSMLLAPSGLESTIRMKMYEGSNTLLTHQPNDAKVTLHRNELSAVRYEYNAETGGIMVSVWLDNSWEQVNQLDIE